MKGSESTQNVKINNQFRADKGALEQIIIQCPSCETRFALESSTLASKESPKFHCSRCDNIFTLQDNVESATATPMMPEEEPNAPGKEEAAFHISDEELPTPTDLGDQIEFPFPKEPPKYHESENLNSYVFNSQKHDLLPPSHPEEQMSFDISAGEDGPALHIPTKTSEWSGFYVFSAPVMVFLTLLLAASFYLRADPKFAEAFSSAVFLPKIQVPPPGLFIEGLRFKSVGLDNGETVSVVSGSLVNETRATFSRISVEGMVFDGDGKVAATQLVDAGSALSKARIKSLTTEMIDHLQNTKRKEKSLDLAPGHRHEFAIALTGDGATKARHYSARVYSVNY